ncbi:MAG: hypothetical protein HC867_03895 [Bacteroidia bacterium]|nr:hypothetical protein [Bacteroidia bacterium]
MVVLGIHHGHDSSAAIVRDGEIIADVQEERFSRIKHSSNAPLKAIAYCLKTAGIKDINDLDYISFSNENNSDALNTIFGLVPEKPAYKKLAKKMMQTVFRRTFDYNNLKLPIYYPDYNICKKSKCVNNNHHLTHAASAYFYAAVE